MRYQLENPLVSSWALAHSEEPPDVLPKHYMVLNNNTRQRDITSLYPTPLGSYRAPYPDITGCGYQLLPRSRLDHSHNLLHPWAQTNNHLKSSLLITSPHFQLYKTANNNNNFFGVPVIMYCGRIPKRFNPLLASSSFREDSIRQPAIQPLSQSEID